MSSIDELSAAIGGNAEQAREVAGGLGASKEQAGQLADALAGLGLEGKASEANAVVDDLEKLTGQQLALAEQIEQARARAEALRGLLASTGATSGNPSLTEPAHPAPPPQSDTASASGRSIHDVTKPSLPPNPARRPDSDPTPIPPRAKRSKQLDIQSENDAAVALARSGFRIEQNPPPKLILSLDRGRACDLRVCDMDGAVDAGLRTAGSLLTFFFSACRNSAVIRLPAFDRVGHEETPIEKGHRLSGATGIRSKPAIGLSGLSSG